MAKIKPSVKKPRSAVARFCRGSLMCLTVFVGLMVLLSGYAGYINPVSFRYASLMVLTFSIWFYVLLGLMAIDLFLMRKAALVAAAALLLTLPTVLDFFPLNIFNRSVPEGATELKLLSYNVCSFTSVSREYPAGGNATVSYILNSGADIVCLQEAGSIGQTKSFNITAAQVDSLHRTYPYIYTGGNSQSILSKYPVEPLRTDFRHSTSGSFDLAVFRVKVAGQNITLFNVHLQSMGLTLEDREVYREFTHMKADDNIKKNIDEVKTQVLGKIIAAGVTRAENMPALMKYITRYGGPNVIVTGDFNDVAWSYPLIDLERAGFKQVYPEVGFGPTVTYYASGIYFRIDHTLYRGCLKPLDVERGHIKTSDHYPLLSTFAVTPKK